MANFRFDRDGRLIVIPVKLSGKGRSLKSEFILDTGASLTVIDHSLINSLGYSVRDGIGFSTLSSVVGKERGYRLKLEAVEALGQMMTNLEVACHDLKQQGVDGLLGMNVLELFNWCVHPHQNMIVVDKKHLPPAS